MAKQNKIKYNMGIDLPIVVYTHSDAKDVWPVFFGQLKKYIGDMKVYVAVNSNDETIPSEYTQLIYDDSIPYTERWKQILPQIKEETIMFMHEDMILFDKPDFEYIKRYYNLVNNDMVDSIKMVYVASNDVVSDIDNTLISNEYSKFSIQPTLIKRKNFVSLLESTPPLNIWDFELAVPTSQNHFMCKVGGEKKRGMYHYDSIVFPYICTAIVKGKWNMNEYQNELDKLFGEYGINPFERGIV